MSGIMRIVMDITKQNPFILSEGFEIYFWSAFKTFRSPARAHSGTVFPSIPPV
jgi:hypothetical protein